MISVIAVNHNSSALLKECFASVISSVRDDAFECIGIDSGSSDDDIKSLLPIQNNNIRIILNRENIGYATAVNMGIRLAKGDFILITNPDVVYKPESIHHMLRALKTLPQCGAVGPKTWWNRTMTFLLPGSEIITPYSIFKTEVMKGSQSMHRAVLRGWIKRTLRYWFSKGPLEQEMLAGACIMTTKNILNTIGWFDEIFPLYFEDTDWCLQVRKAGYCLYMVPQAEIIHYYNQSAKQDIERSQKKFDTSMDKYMRKHFRKQLFFMRPLLGLVKNIQNNVKDMYDDIGMVKCPPLFQFQSDSKKLFLLSPVYSMMPSAGAFFDGEIFKIPEDLWCCLGEGRYFARAFDLAALEDCGSWTWLKHHSDTIAF